jgi:hypothetical protein
MRQRSLSLVLRTPLHVTVSRRFLLLTELDGVALSPPVAVRFAANGEDLVALAPPGAAWWRSIPADPPVQAVAELRGKPTSVTAHMATGEELDESVLRYLQKYPGEWRELGIDAAADPDDVQAAAHGSAVVVFRRS